MRRDDRQRETGALVRGGRYDHDLVSGFSINRSHLVCLLLTAALLTLLGGIWLAEAVAHPGHTQLPGPQPVPPPVAPPPEPEGVGASGLLIAAVVVGLLGLAVLLVAMKKSRAPAAFAPPEPLGLEGTQKASEANESSGLSEAQQARSRLRPIFAGGGLLVVALVIGLAWLFGPGGSAPAEPQDLAETAYVDGTLTVVEGDRLVMQPFEPLDGQSEIEFTIREADAANFDTAHLQSHSSVALPTRIYYERSGEQLFARYKEDAPVNSASGG